MATAAHANLVGITGIARRLVMDGVLAEDAAREAMTGATQARKPLALYLVENKLVAPVQLAAANSVEFGMPIFDLGAMDPNQSAIKLVNEELVRKHAAVPLFKRGGRLYVGISDPTNTRALDEFKFATNLAVEAILVDVGPCRQAPFAQRHAERLEIAVGHTHEHREQRRSVGGSGARPNLDTRAAQAAPAERQRARATCGGHPRNRGNLIQYPAIDADRARVFDPRTQAHAGGDDVLDAEPRTDGVQTHHAAEHQTGGNEHDGCDRDLRDDQCPAHAMPRPAGTAAAASLPNGGGQRPA